METAVEQLVLILRTLKAIDKVVDPGADNVNYESDTVMKNNPAVLSTVLPCCDRLCGDNYTEKVLDCASKLEGICEKLGLAEMEKSLENCVKKLKKRKFTAGILGELKRGKTSVVNSLLGEEILPADILSLPVACRVIYSTEKRAQLNIADGTVRDIPVEKLKLYLTGDREIMKKNITEAAVYYPCPFCLGDVDLLDLPGLNCDEDTDAKVNEAIPFLDAVVMVLSHDNPFSSTEAEFLTQMLMPCYDGKIIFLVNKMDNVKKEEDAERIVAEIKERIRRTVKEKMLGDRLGDIEVYPFSAAYALDGKTSGDSELLRKSGAEKFENALKKMLDECCAAGKIKEPLAAISRSAAEIKRSLAIEARLSPDERREIAAALEKIKSRLKPVCEENG